MTWPNAFRGTPVALVEKRCDNCRFSEPAGDGNWFVCRRNPPIPMMRDGFCGVWPRVAADKWCGEFSPRPAE